MKTSSSDPLRVDFLAAADLGLPGRVGMTLAPGKRDPARGWDRDLAADLARLRALGVDTLVCLVEDHELRQLGIPDLLERAANAGLATRRFPIVDVTAPPASSMAEFAALVDEIVAAAAAGRGVAIHCRGGLGRSGLLAACCLVDRGHQPRRAIERVRQVRPGAVETDEQERWVDAFARRLRPGAGAVAGCLLGGALGDALGYPVEFLGAAEIVAAIGAAAPARLAARTPAPFSDDTQMTLFVAEGCIRAAQAGGGDALAAIDRALLRWYATQGGAIDPALRSGWLVAAPGLSVARAPGGTCLGALAARARGAARPDPAHPANNSKGCGAVMRSAPIGLVAPSRAAAFALARDAGALTHGHPSGHLSAAVLAALVFDVARGAALDAALDAAAPLLAAAPGHEETAGLLSRARALAAAGPPTLAAVESLGGGWTGEEALAIAVLCALGADRGDEAGVRRALWAAAAHSGDSDSTASLAGNLVGAAVGLAGLPGGWLADLELREVVARVAADLHRACLGGERLDAGDYPEG